MPTRWYTVRLLLRAEGVDQPKKRPLYEDRWLIVEATDSNQARKKGVKLAREPRYRNLYGKWVKWRIARVVDVRELFEAPLEDGSEVYWRFFYSADPVKRIEREGIYGKGL